MKLDSEEQRQELLKLLSTITWQVTIDTIDEAKAKIIAFIDPIRTAEIESDSPGLQLSQPDPDVKDATDA